MKETTKDILYRFIAGGIVLIANVLSVSGRKKDDQG